MPEPEFVERAEEAVDRHTAPPPGARRHGTGADRDSLRREQQDEAAEVWVGPGAPAMTSGQLRGGVLGGLVGAVVGALVFLPLAAVPVDVPVWLRILVVAVVGAMAGATAGSLYFGGRMPELEGETLDADGRPSVGTTLRDPGTDARGR
jgi:uncharacterized membrane protein YeaQ/YmgE (transglycosylase-associated protein family)